MDASHAKESEKRRRTIVSVDGNIGCSKSTVVAALRALGHDTFLEPVEEWEPFLRLLYEDAGRWGFTFDAVVLLSYAHLRDARGGAPIVVERSPFACKEVFAGMRRHAMAPCEARAFDRLFERVGWEPDHVIYLRASPTTCLERVKRRARPSEAALGLPYLEAVHARYEATVAGLLASPGGGGPSGPEVHVVDADRDDAGAVLADVLAALDRILVRGRDGDQRDLRDRAAQAHAAP